MGILELKNVYYNYRNKHQTVEVLKDVSCSFETGKIYAIIGKSGSGKSTMLSLMAGLDVPTSGQVLYEGIPTSEMDLDRYRREGVAVIYQNFRLFPLLTISENITYPMELRGFKGEPARQKAKELIRKVALPETVLDRFPAMLSGGEQQRVAIARALSMDTKLILADEPTGNLDEENSRNIIDILVSLARNDNYCVVMVTHDLSVIPRMDVVYRLSGGQLFPE